MTYRIEELSEKQAAVIRHRLAWDRAKAEDRTNPDGSRNLPQMMGVDYDEPRRTAKDERLPVIGRHE